MTNKDTLTNKKLELQESFCKALKADDAEGVAKAFDAIGEFYAEEIRKEFNDYKNKIDSSIIAKAGIKQYTSVEIKAFKGVIDSAKAAGNIGVSVPISAFPDTYINRLIDGAIEESPLLQAINITNTGFLTTMLLDDSEDQPATWTGMGETISEAEFGTETLSLTHFKLAKIIYIPNEMLDMGPEWLASFVERKMRDCIRLGLETSVVTGGGAKGPVGMNRTKLKGTDADKNYPVKDSIKVTSFKPVEYGKLVSNLVTNSKGRTRKFDKVILVAHPTTILTKILPASSVRKPDGTYSEMCFPFPTIVIPTVALDEDASVLGIYKRYEMYLGKGTSTEGNIVEDKSIKFAEHMTAIKIYLYGNGSFVDENDNINLDLSELQAANQEVFVINDAENPVIMQQAGTSQTQGAEG